ncbi:hypothetical protein KQR54_05580 [Mycobacterium gordonae]|uniref:hypothetical protein n=1 Tax=Mycobacterium gordonae TaxID=1778 RepID=UPI00210EE21B|nr:hypothetical protein [Mycobacterium gordonae]MCQ4360621.1 hypothetical protein [Mycobacterium gordonae]
MAGDGEITVDLEGEALDPRAIADAITQVENLVQSLSTGGTARLVLTDLRGGSAHISMSVTGASIDSLHDGLEVLRQSAVVPPGWRRDSLQAVANLGNVTTQRGVDSLILRIGEAISAIDRTLQQNAEKALEPSSRSLGAVRGTLYRYTNDAPRSRRSAGLRNVHTGDSIELRFSAEVAPLVREQLESEVEVWGEIGRDATGKIVHLVVEGIQAVATSHPTRAGDGRGLLGQDWTGGVDPVDWVRSQRG